MRKSGKFRIGAAIASVCFSPFLTLGIVSDFGIRFDFSARGSLMGWASPRCAVSPIWNRLAVRSAGHFRLGGAQQEAILRYGRLICAAVRADRQLIRRVARSWSQRMSGLFGEGRS